MSCVTGNHLAIAEMVFPIFASDSCPNVNLGTEMSKNLSHFSCF